MPDNLVLCEACNKQFDDSCGQADNEGLWFCEKCWGERIADDAANQRVLLEKMRDERDLPNERN